ncbi:hypothetical protein Acsp02_45070 [Actinoplanes sp. NBRC 103695]|nr:hypothetical protein Acsp02_45070 [Actinoplanes sp. NBRC 103695]
MDLQPGEEVRGDASGRIDSELARGQLRRMLGMLTHHQHLRRPAAHSQGRASNAAKDTVTAGSDRAKRTTPDTPPADNA